LMTSDSDFTPLVLRILESGLPVYGFGEKKTPKAFVDACSLFIYTEKLLPGNGEKKEKKNAPVRKDSKALVTDSELVQLLRKAVEQSSGDDDWSNLAKVGSYISNNSSFSPVNYGYKRLGDLIKATNLFEIDMRHDGSVMYIRDARNDA